jgi:hypothetical protein
MVSKLIAFFWPFSVCSDTPTDMSPEAAEELNYAKLLLVLDRYIVRWYFLALGLLLLGFNSSDPFVEVIGITFGFVFVIVPIALLLFKRYIMRKIRAGKVR